jgi:hypothetical protein
MHQTSKGAIQQTKMLAETKIMEEIIGKPIDPSASGGAILDSPPKWTISLIREGIRGPFSRYPAVNRPISATKPTVLTRPLVRQKIVSPVSRYPAVDEPISTPTLNSVSSVEAELAEVRNAWATYRSTNGRDAIYIYLTAVFRLVMRWRRLNCAVKNSRAALRLRSHPPQMKPEPFAIVIFCTSDSNIADAKTRSKWSRVLRYTARAKPAGQRLTDFVKSNGGLNECASKFARIGNELLFNRQSCRVSDAHFC